MIILDKLEAYGELKSFQFTEKQRLYFCKNMNVIDLTTFHKIEVSDLLIVVYNNVQTAELCKFAQNHINSGKPVIFAQEEKTNNKRERHEISAKQGSLLLNNDVYNFKKLFARAELQKTVPQRLIIEY